MKFTDEMLMAYADGELDAELRAQIDAAISHDAALAQIVEQHRRLRGQVRNAFAAELTEPMPERLLALLNTAGSAAPVAKTDNVIELAPRKRRWTVREWSAIAATLVLGAALGIALPEFRQRDLIATTASGLVAQGPLARALTEQLAASQSAADSVRIGISFKTRDGDYCRTFSLTQGQELAGLACHQDKTWRVQMLTATRADPAINSTYRQAGSAMPGAILNWVDHEIADEPLDAEAERAAQQGGWARH